MHTSIINTLHDPAVRDLAWVIGSPGLPDALYAPYRGRVVDDAWCNSQLEQAAPWLQQLDLTPQPLHDYIAARPTRRLGHYFETLISYWLLHLPQTQILATNLQVQTEQRTLGEFDFLFRDSHGDICHWEVAVKFYLQAQPLAEQRAFIGPGTRDRLDLKMDRVFKHQLHLGYDAEGQQALPQGIMLNKSQAFIKGYLFHHVADSNKAQVSGISPEHLCGWWAHHKLETLPRTSIDSHWVSLPRMRWLSPACLAHDASVMSLDELRGMLDAHFQLKQDALLLCELQPTDDGWQEISRGFVVCPSWPIISTPDTQ